MVEQPVHVLKTIITTIVGVRDISGPAPVCIQHAFQAPLKARRYQSLQRTQIVVIHGEDPIESLKVTPLELAGTLGAQIDSMGPSHRNGAAIRCLPCMPATSPCRVDRHILEASFRQLVAKDSLSQWGATNVPQADE